VRQGFTGDAQRSLNSESLLPPVRCPHETDIISTFLSPKSFYHFGSQIMKDTVVPRGSWSPRKNAEKYEFFSESYFTILANVLEITNDLF